MGKKYEAWIDASQAKRASEMDLAGAQGGCTEARLTEANNNAEQNRLNEELTYREWRQDPNG